MNLLLSIWKWLPNSRVLKRFALRRVNDQFLIGVTGVIFNQHHEVLLVRHTYRRVAWSLPGGYLQANEHPKTGLAREIFEETGFVVHIIRIIHTNSTDTGHLDMSYFGVYVSGDFKPSSEVSAYRFVSPNNLPKLIDDQYAQIANGYERLLQYERKKRWGKIRGVAKQLLPFLH